MPTVLFRLRNEDVYNAYWSPDDKYILTQTESVNGYMIMPLTGGTPKEIKIEASVSGKQFPFRFSDDLEQIAFTVLREDGLKDIYVAPFSVAEARTTGPADLVFEGWSAGAYNVLISWSRDGRKMAVVHEGDIWIVHLDSGMKEKITDTPEKERWVDFSPDGQIIRHLFNIKDLGLANNSVELRFSPNGKYLAFVGYIDDNDQSLIITYSMETGKVSRLCDENLNDGKYSLVWSHDGKWISYLGYEEVKIPPEGTLWEADFEEIMEKSAK